MKRYTCFVWICILFLFVFGVNILIFVLCHMYLCLEKEGLYFIRGCSSRRGFHWSFDQSGYWDWPKVKSNQTGTTIYVLWILQIDVCFDYFCIDSRIPPFPVFWWALSWELRLRFVVSQEQPCWQDVENSFISVAYFLPVYPFYSGYILPPLYSVVLLPFSSLRYLYSHFKIFMVWSGSNKSDLILFVLFVAVCSCTLGYWFLLATW